MKNFISQFARLALISLIAINFYFPATINLAKAADDPNICLWVNTQNGSVGDSSTLSYDPPLPTTDPDYAANQKKRASDFQAKYETALADQNQLKTNFAQYANKIAVITEEPLGTSSDISTHCTRITTCSMGYYDLNNPYQVKRCFTRYTAPNICSGNNSDASGNSTYCEQVQIYFADGGTALLYGYIGLIYKYIAMIGGFIAVLVLIVAGVMRAASGDNAAQVTKANELFVRCITGLVVLFLSAVILYTINPNFFTL